MSTCPKCQLPMLLPARAEWDRSRLCTWCNIERYRTPKEARTS